MTARRALSPVTQIALLVLAVADLVAASGSLHSAAFFSSVLAVFGLLLHRRWPVATLLLGLPNVVIGYALVAQLIATFEVARRSRDRRGTIPLLGLVAVLQVIGMFLLSSNSAPTDYSAQRVVFAVLIVGGPASCGLLARAYSRLAEQLGELEDRRRRETDLAARAVVAAERTRLAREMHDVVSHNVSLIAVQTGALRMTATDPTTRQMADTVRGLAVKTLEELRDMVAVLRDRSNPDDELAPQPRLGDLDDLVRAHGTSATLQRTVPPGQTWPDAVERAAYRTVQEGLTNVRKHANGAVSHIEVTGEHNVLVVAVRNGPAPRPTNGAPGGAAVAPLPSGGQGLIGLRERAELLGGSLVHGPCADGGFELVARLPAGSAAQRVPGLLGSRRAPVAEAARVRRVEQPQP